MGAGSAEKPRLNPRRRLNDISDLPTQGTDVRTEFIAGVTTFLTMVYIVFVNPDHSWQDRDGSGRGFRRDLHRRGVSTFVMALYANYPIALAPGMGINAFFAFTVVLTYKYTWQQALASVFCSDVCFFYVFRYDNTPLTQFRRT